MSERLTNRRLHVTLALSHHSEQKGDTLSEQLTDRQREILDRLKRNMKPAQVADDLGISRNAVYQHITSLRRAGQLDDGRTAAAGDDVLDSLAALVRRAEQRITEISEQETQLKAERDQLAAFIERSRDLVAV